MKTLLVLILLLAECCGLAEILHLWRHSSTRHIPARCFWSLVLLIPIFGLMFYFFIRLEPEPHGENKWVNCTSGWDGG